MENDTVFDGEVSPKTQLALRVDSAPNHHYRQQESLDLQPFSPITNERSYLLDNLQKQEKRAKRFSDNLAGINSRLASAENKGDARKLRKEASILRGKMAETENQLQLITLGLRDLDIQESNRQLRMTPQPMGWHQFPDAPWYQNMIVPGSPMTPMMTPISPMTPLPPGFYQPFPVAPSPMESHFQYPMHYPMHELQTEILLGPDSILRRHSVQDQKVDTFSDAEIMASSRRMSVQTMGGGEEEIEYIRRRWSVADIYTSPTRDKRISLPGLQSIWRED